MRRLLALLSIILLLAPGLARGQGVPATVGIAAVVNDQVITQFDLDQRVAVAISSAGFRDTPDMRARLRSQVLRTLIDEVLQRQEAKRLNISVSNDDIENAKRTVEQRNNIPRNGFSRFLTQQGIPENSVVQQMTAEITWNRVVRQVLVPQVDIGEQEIDAELTRIVQSNGKYRYLMSEIFLPAEAGQRDADLRAQAQRMADDIRGGANFTAAARQFSRGPSAFDAGDIGWVMEDQLAPELAQVVRTLDVGAVSNPVASGGGYYLMQVRDRRQIGVTDPRETRLHLKQVVLPITATTPAVEAARAEVRAQSISDSVKGCDAMDAIIKEVGNPQSGDLGTIKLGDLPERFRGGLANLEVGRSSAPLRSDVGVHVFMICERTLAATEIPTRDEVGQTLGQQRLEQLERRYMRDLRRNATLDVRVR